MQDPVNAPCHRRPTADEQHVLEHLSVRPLEPHETERFDQLIVQHHYLKVSELVGEHLRYVATYQGQWLALAAWCAPVWHLKARDAFIGWTDEQRRTRLPLLANNARLLVLPDCHSPSPACWPLCSARPCAQGRGRRSATRPCQESSILADVGGGFHTASAWVGKMGVEAA